MAFYFHEDVEMMTYGGELKHITVHIFHSATFHTQCLLPNCCTVFVFVINYYFNIFQP